MLYTVTCTGCGTDFPVDPRKVPEEGVYAQCSECPQIFFVERAALLAATPPTVTFSPPAEVTAEAEPALAQASAPTVAPDPPMAETQPADTPVVDEPAAWTGEADAGVAEVQPTEAQTAPAFESSEASFGTDTPAEANEWQGSTEAAPATSGQTATEVQPEEAAAVATAPRGFGRRDPHERAGRLARVLVSDMIAYHPDRHSQSLQNQTLATDFEEEIEKSWNEYVQQVGKDLAESTSYWKDALNQVLARGQQLF